MWGEWLGGFVPSGTVCEMNSVFRGVAVLALRGSNVCMARAAAVSVPGALHHSLLPLCVGLP